MKNLIKYYVKAIKEGRNTDLQGSAKKFNVTLQKSVHAYQVAAEIAELETAEMLNDKRIDELKCEINKNKEQILAFKIITFILLFSFFASIFYNAKLEQKNRLLSTEIDNIIIKSEKIMLISLQQKSILDKHIKLKGLSNKEKKKMLFDEKIKRINKIK